jgi:tRNA (cmo5U34)-methyltransferase
MRKARGNSSLRREFDREASGYDRTAPASMPGYMDLHRTLIGGIPYLPTRRFRILELGVGTGTLTAQVLARFPQAELRGIDISPRMIAAARRKLAPFRDRVELVAGSLEAFEEQPFEVVLSALAIHHLSDAAK